MNDIYDPFKATVESILEMCEKYGSFESISEDERVRANDFLNNIRVKCKDAIEYDKLFLANMDKDLKNAVDSYYHMHADKNLDYMFLAKTASHFINWERRKLEKELDDDLEKEILKEWRKHAFYHSDYHTDIVQVLFAGYQDIARHFANWQKSTAQLEKLVNTSYENGYKQCKEDMMKDYV